MYNAYGDWEVNVDPSTLLFSNRWEEILLSKCSKQKEHAAKEAETENVLSGANKDAVGQKGKSGEKVEHKTTKCGNGISNMNKESPVEKSVPSNQPTPAKVSHFFNPFRR